MFVRWGDTCSTSFCVTNGVKQGGIISPMFFNLYMDDLSLMLNCSGIIWIHRKGSARPEVRGTAEPHGGAYPP